MSKTMQQQKASDTILQFDEELIEKIKNVLVKKSATLAVAESVTSGLLQAACTQAKDASQYFHGGITAYNLGQKARHFNVDTNHAEACNCVSKTVAEQMAVSVTRLFFSDYGIATTGYANTVPGQGIDKTYAWCAVAHQGKVVFSKKINAANIEEGLSTQLFFVNQCLKYFNQIISKK